MQALTEQLGSFSNGLFVYSDPGGAKPILSFVALLKKRFPRMHLTVISDREYDFSQEFTAVEIVDNIEEWLLKAPSFEFVFTGTSYTSSLELIVLKWAKGRKLKTFSFVDHWTEVKNRFKYQDQYHLPESILVIDAKAKSNAVQDGIAEALIQIIENPYHTYLSAWMPKVSREEFLAKIPLSGLSKLILTFAPDAISNHGWLEKYGADESTILDAILRSMVELKANNCQLLIQPHPNQNIELLQAVINKEEFRAVEIILLTQVDVPTLLWYSDLVIGQFSNILIEAAIFKKPIVRYVPSSIPDYMEKNIGTKVMDKTAFKACILDFIVNLS